MDISSRCQWPLSELSNFAAHDFTIDGVECSSMEGFLQSLKFQSPRIQRAVCKLVGIDAKRRGKRERWQETQLLWWQGKALPRQSEAYQRLLDRAFFALSQNEGFQKALLATKDQPLTHSIGKSDPTQTVLTETEFCSRLMKIRKEIRT